MEIDRLPIRIVPWIKGATVCVEFIGEHKYHLAAIFIRWYVVHLGRCVLVDEAKVPDVRYLTGRIGIDTVPTIATVVRRSEIHNHRISDTGGRHD